MFESLKIEKTQHFYTHHSLLLNVLWGDLRLDHVLSISGACEHLVRQHGTMSSIVVVRGEYGIDLSPELRRAGANLMSKFEKTLIAQALVMEAEGFKSSMARSAITAVNLLARSRARQRVFKDPHEAAVWVCSQEQQPPEVRLGARRIATEVQELLAKLPP